MKSYFEFIFKSSVKINLKGIQWTISLLTTFSIFQWEKIERERESRRVGEEEWCDGIPLPLGDLKKHRYETGRKITNGDRKRD